MSFNAEWTNADALAFRPYTAYASAPVTYSATTDPMSDLQRENAKLRELLDFALPIAMYAASTEEGDRMREIMREVEL